MKKHFLIIMLAWAAMPLIAQNSSSALQIESQGSGAQLATNSYYSFDTEKKMGNIVKEEDVYYYYLYDFCCGLTQVYEDKYFIKLYMGKSIDDVTASYKTIKKWYKKAKMNEYIIVSNPNGQKVLLYKSLELNSSKVITVTYGTIDDAIWAAKTYKAFINSSFSGAVQSAVPILGLLNNGLLDNLNMETYMQNKIAEGSYRPASHTTLKLLEKAVKAAKKAN